MTPARDVVWRMNMEFFVKATESIMKYSTDDVILDIGCGAGYLPEALHDRVREVHGADVSQQYLDHCQAKLGRLANCYFHKLDEAGYTDLSFLPEQSFTKIVCLSVIQYYDRSEDLEKLVRSIRRVAAPGALCLISDIPGSAAASADALSLLSLAARKRRLFHAVRYLLKMRFSEYHEVRTQKGVLDFEVADLNQLAGRLGLDAEVLTDQLTVNRSRHHWLIRF